MIAKLLIDFLFLIPFLMVSIAFLLEAFCFLLLNASKRPKLNASKRPKPSGNRRGISLMSFVAVCIHARSDRGEAWPDDRN